MIIKDNRILYGGSNEPNQKQELAIKLKETFSESLRFINSLLQKIESNKINEENFNNMKELIEKIKLLNQRVHDTELNYQTESGNRDEMMEAINTLSTNITSKVEAGYNFQVSYSNNSKQLVFSEIIDAKGNADITNKIVINLEEKLNSLIDKLNANTQENTVEINEEIRKLNDYFDSTQAKITNIVAISKTLKELNDTFKSNIILDKIPLDLDDESDDLIAENKNASYFENPEQIKNDYITYQGDEKKDDIEKKKDDTKELLSFDDQMKLISNSDDNFSVIYDPNKLSKINKELKGGSSKQSKEVKNSGLKISEFINKNSSYADVIRRLNGQINKVKEQIKPLNKHIMIFNLNYIHLYHNIKFMENYTNSNLLNSENNVLFYKYLGKGIIAYYLNIINEIEKDIKGKTPIGNYFYKYHYFNIEIVKNFLLGLRNIKNWLWSTTIDDATKKIEEEVPKSDVSKTRSFLSSFTSFRNNKSTVPQNTFEQNLKENLNTKLKEYNIISKIDLTKFDELKDTDNGKKMLNSIFIFNAFKDYLDEFQLSQANKVGVYLRINDWGNITAEQKVFDVKDNILNIESLNKCKKAQNIEKAAKVKFKQIFDPDSFTKNNILANYMSLPNFLSKGQSIMLITYGYSGVGKTYTIFGSTKPKLDGVLQTSLKQLISLKKPMYYRAYEIYGRAFPYKSYWEKQACDYAHYINHFSINGQTITVQQKKPTPSTNGNCKNQDDMKNFIYEINSDPQNTQNSFIPLDIDTLNTFEQIVGKIDDKRQEIGTIRRTINNKVSSRSIMVYDFKILLKPETNEYVNFVVMDLPGKENIYETFVNTPSVNQYECIKVRNSGGEDYDKMIKAMAFMNPMSLMLNDDNLPYVDFNLISDLKNKNLLVVGVDKPGELVNHQYKPINQDDKNNIIAVEIIKNIINGNEFDKLNQIYEKIFRVDPISQSDKNGNCINGQIEDCKNYCSTVSEFVLTPFEGYYINENIIGLLSSILNNLFLPNIIEEQQEIYMSLESNPRIWHPDYKEPNEVKMQTYFFRSLLRSEFKTKSLTLDNYDKAAPYKTKIGNKYISTYKDWIEETYDYNKAYRRNKPPINEILKPYFDQIKNIYVFYVVSNQNYSKCDKQIKLISDSSDFLDILDMYTKSEEDMLKIQLDNLKKETDVNEIILFLNKPNSLPKFKRYKNYQFIKFLEVLDDKNIKYKIEGDEVVRLR